MPNNYRMGINNLKQGIDTYTTTRMQRVGLFIVMTMLRPPHSPILALVGT